MRKIDASKSNIPFAVFLFILAIVFFMLWQGFFTKVRYVKEQGEATTATITEVNIDSKGSHTYYDIQYSYTVDGEVYTNDLDTWALGTNKGTKLTVYYMPESPWESYTLYGRSVFVFLGLFTSAFGVLIILGELTRSKNGIPQPVFIYKDGKLLFNYKGRYSEQESTDVEL